MKIFGSKKFNVPIVCVGNAIAGGGENTSKYGIGKLLLKKIMMSIL